MEPVDPFFRQYFLSSIESIIHIQDPDSSSLLKLLQTVVPTLTMAQLSDSIDRNKAFKLLKLRIHPDKHLGDFNQATKIFQDIQEFYHSCCQRLQLDDEGIIIVDMPSSNDIMKTRKHKKSKTYSKQDFDENHVTTTNHTHHPSSMDFPDSFTVFDKWEYMSTDSPSPPITTNTNDEIPSYISAIRAFQCLNARGAIASGMKITKGFTYQDDVRLYPSNKQEEHILPIESSTLINIFQIHGGGYRVFNTISQIKHELFHYGPVVSTSFVLTSNYLTFISKNHTNLYKQFVSTHDNNDKKTIAKTYHPLLIVGWIMTIHGEFWLCEPLFRTNINDDILSPPELFLDSHGGIKFKHLIPIAMVQFGIENMCIAPKVTTLDHLCWQLGPYFDVDFADTPDWREWEELELPLVDSELKKLFQIFFPTGYTNTGSDHTPIVLRDKNKPAHCGTFLVSGLKWSNTTNEWFMTLIRKA